VEYTGFRLDERHPCQWRTRSQPPLARWRRPENGEFQRPYFAPGATTNRGSHRPGTHSSGTRHCAHATSYPTLAAPTAAGPARQSVAYPRATTSAAAGLSATCSIPTATTIPRTDPWAALLSAARTGRYRQRPFHNGTNSVNSCLMPDVCGPFSLSGLVELGCHPARRH